MTLELVLFILLAVVAIFAAAMMLVSRNAVHSALFLVLNFICVAMFYLMLHAPFLAMIQVTVYAGAIMVLFMFVIMLLGSERLGGETGPYRWLAPSGVALTTIFLAVAYIVIVQGNVGLLKPIPRNPELRVVHAVSGVPRVDFYLNGTKALEEVGYGEATKFAQVLPGEYDLQVYPACEGTNCPDPIASKEKPVAQQTITLAPETATTYVISGSTDSVKMLVVPTDLTTLADERTARLQVVNALPDTTIGLIKVNPANASETSTLVSEIVPGVATEPLVLQKDSYNLAFTRNGERFLPISNYQLSPKTAALIVVTQEKVPSTGQVEPVDLSIAAPTNEDFGSPQMIGYSMLSNFVLPFELVSLLLLAAMVGAIILTREEVVRRVRERISFSDRAAMINRAATQTNQNAAAKQSESSAD